MRCLVISSDGCSPCPSQAGLVETKSAVWKLGCSGGESDNGRHISYGSTCAQLSLHPAAWVVLSTNKHVIALGRAWCIRWDVM